MILQNDDKLALFPTLNNHSRYTWRGLRASINLRESSYYQSLSKTSQKTSIVSGFEFSHPMLDTWVFPAHVGPCGVPRCRWAPRTRERWGVGRMMVRYAAASGLWIYWANEPTSILILMLLMLHSSPETSHCHWFGEHGKFDYKHTPHPHLSLSVHLQHQDVRKLLLGSRSICSELTRRTLSSAQPRTLYMNRFLYIFHTHTNTHIRVCIYVFIYI